MTSKLTIEKYIRTIEKTPTQEEQLIMMLRGLIKLFPLWNAYFFRYSPIGFLSEGIVYINHDGNIELMRNVKDDLRSLPTILSTVQNRNAEFISTETYITHSKHFPHRSLVPSMLIVPICLSANVVGYTVSTQFNDNASIDTNLLDLLSFYGKRFGKLLEKNFNYHPISTLSKRETEVMQLLAYGYSVKEIAYSLNLSEHTVRDYIKSAIKKTKANNRLHAIVLLLRKEIIV